MIGSLSRSLGTTSTSTDWVRPSDWLALPTVGSSEQKFVGLVAVFDTDSNYLAFTCAGAYTVDWGDGTVENIATNTKAQHQYVYSGISNSTLCSRGYKQVIVTITPQTGNLTSINLQQTHSSNAVAYVSSFLDILLSCQYLTSLTIGGTTTYHSLLEQVTIRNHALTSCSNLFSNCYSLVSVPLFNMASVTTTQNMFLNCYSVVTVPLFNTVSVTNMTSMFSSCASLLSVPLFNTISVTNMASMFNACVSLLSAPLFNTMSVVDMSSMFQNCQSLISVPLFNTASVTNMNSMFAACFAVKSIPLFNTALVTNMSFMFTNCRKLITLPLFNTSSVTNASSMLSNCFALSIVPAFNFSSVTSTTSPFSTCPSISKVLITGLRYTLNLAGMSLSATEINNIFTNLGTAVGTQTITITGNRGATTCTPSIATAKGFTVVT